MRKNFIGFFEGIDYGVGHHSSLGYKDYIPLQSTSIEVTFLQNCPVALKLGCRVGGDLTVIEVEHIPSGAATYGCTQINSLS